MTTQQRKVHSSVKAHMNIKPAGMVQGGDKSMGQ